MLDLSFLGFFYEIRFSKKQSDFLYMIYMIIYIYSKNSQIYFKDFLVKAFFYMKDFLKKNKIYDMEAYDIVNYDNVGMLLIEALYTIKYYNVNHYRFKKPLSVNNYFSEKELYNIEKNIF